MSDQLINRRYRSIRNELTFGENGVSVETGTADPTIEIVNAKKGSLYLCSANGMTYQKQTDEVDLNWEILPTASGGSSVDSVNGQTGTVVLTKTDVGLSNVDNTSDANKPVSSAQLTALNLKVDKTTTVNGHALSANVTVTKSDVGLGNVDNTSDTSKPVSTAQATADGVVQAFAIQRANHTGTQLASTISDFSTASDARVATFIDDSITDGVTTHAPSQNAVFDALALKASSSGLSTHIADVANPHAVTKTQVGLSNVPNTDATLRANHTGTQLASTISDFTSAAKAAAVADTITDAVTDVAPSQNAVFDALALKYTNSVSTNKLLGRATAGTGVVEEITLGTNLSFTGTTLNVAASSGPKMAQVSLSPSNIGVANNTAVLIPWDTVENDPNSLFVLASNGFKVPTGTVGTANGTIGAIVTFGTNIGSDTNDHIMILRVFKNGTLYKDLVQLHQLFANPNTPSASGVTGWVGVANDVFTIKVYQFRVTSGASLDIGNDTRFTNAHFTMY